MADADNKQKPARSGGGCLKRGIFLSVFFILVLMIGGVLFVRSNSGRVFIEERLCKILKMEVTVASARIGFPYVLILDGVKSEAFGLKQTGRLTAGEVRLAPSLRTMAKVTLLAPELRLVREADGRWIPEEFSELGDLASTNLLVLGDMTYALRRKVALQVSDGTLRWFAGDGTEIATARGLEFSITPVSIPGRKMYHYRLSLFEATGDERIAVQATAREWLSAEGGRKYIEIERSGPEIPAAAASFWDVGR
jgi:hypothetical protein